MGLLCVLAIVSGVAPSAGVHQELRLLPGLELSAPILGVGETTEVSVPTGELLHGDSLFSPGGGGGGGGCSLVGCLGLRIILDFGGAILGALLGAAAIMAATLPMLGYASIFLAPVGAIPGVPVGAWFLRRLALGPQRVKGWSTFGAIVGGLLGIGTVIALLVATNDLTIGLVIGVPLHFALSIVGLELGYAQTNAFRPRRDRTPSTPIIRRGSYEWRATARPSPRTSPGRAVRSKPVPGVFGGDLKFGEIVYLESAREDLEKIPTEVAEVIRERVQRLILVPRPEGVRKVQGEEAELLALSVPEVDGEIVYEVDGDQIVVQHVRWTGSEEDLPEDGASSESVEAVEPDRPEAEEER